MKTAIDFLANALDINTKSLIFEQAKEMEKQQIIDAYNDGGEKGFNKFGENFEQYYNETYKTK